MKHEVNPCAIVGFYQDRKAGERLLNNLDELKIPSIWVNSRVEGFNQINNSDNCTDGFIELIKSYDNTKVYDLGLTKAGEATTFLYHESSRLGYNYSITLGCDEYLKGDFELFKSNLKMLGLKKPTKCILPLTELNPTGNNNVKYISPRITYLQGLCTQLAIHYHTMAFYNNEWIALGVPFNLPLVLGLEIFHDDRIREPTRNLMMDNFQLVQKEKEKTLINELLNANLEEV